MHKSQAFAAYRTALLAELLNDVTMELLPKFNAEVEDIRREHKDIKDTKGEALADHHKRARVSDLKIRQQQFIDGLNEELRTKLAKRVEEYGGTIQTKKEGEKEKLEAVFPDKSTAAVPKALWINYDQFDRV